MRKYRKISEKARNLSEDCLTPRQDKFLTFLGHLCLFDRCFYLEWGHNVHPWLLEDLSGNRFRYLLSGRVRLNAESHKTENPQNKQRRKEHLHGVVRWGVWALWEGLHLLNVDSLASNWKMLHTKSQEFPLGVAQFLENVFLFFEMLGREIHPNSKGFSERERAFALMISAPTSQRIWKDILLNWLSVAQLQGRRCPKLMIGSDYFFFCMRNRWNQPETHSSCFEVLGTTFPDDNCVLISALPAVCRQMAYCNHSFCGHATGRSARSCLQYHSFGWWSLLATWSAIPNALRSGVKKLKRNLLSAWVPNGSCKITRKYGPGSAWHFPTSAWSCPKVPAFLPGCLISPKSTWFCLMRWYLELGH